ncbi:MAG TPA: MFS transporter [Armatimonadota bacterium]|jgi:MFS family permease
MFFMRFVPKAIQQTYRWDARAAWLAGLYSGMTLPFFGVIARRDLHASPFAISLLISAPFLGHLLSMFVAWHMQNRPKQPYMYWLSLISRLPILFMAFAMTTPVFIGLVIASQILSCFTSPAYASVMKDAYPDNYRGRLMGMVRIGMTMMAMVSGLYVGRLMESGLPRSWVLAVALAAALVIAHEIQRNVPRVLVAALVVLLGYLGAPWLAHALPYRLVFPVAGALGLLAAWMFNHIREAPLEAAGETRFKMQEGLMTLFKDRRFGLYSLGFFICGFGNLLPGPLMPLFQVDELHISNEWVGILAMVGAGTSAVFYGIWGRLMDRYSPLLTVILSFAMCGIAPLIYAHAHSVPTLMFAAIAMGIGNPGIDLTWLNGVMYFTGREGIPRYAAMHTFLVGVRGLLAPFIGTWLLRSLTLRQCFLVAAVILGVGTLFMMVIVRYYLLPVQETGPSLRKKRTEVDLS